MANNNGVVINRVWAMPNRWTFTIKPIAELLSRYVGDGRDWIDPFAGMYSPAEFRNDLNPESNALFHLDAREFLNLLSGKYKGVLFDPPYSPRQISECYKSLGKKPTMEDTQNGRLYLGVKRAIDPLLDLGGIVISFGWNSTGMGRGKNNSGYELVEILLVCHGAAHNDTICTVERKVNGYGDEDRGR